MAEDAFDKKAKSNFLYLLKFRFLFFVKNLS
jgi:hypothetical protein